MLNTVAQLLTHSTAGSMEYLIFLDTVLIFKAQWLQSFLLLLLFLVQETARKTNPPQGLFALLSKAPWYGRHILWDVDSMESAKALYPKIRLHCPLL